MPQCRTCGTPVSEQAPICPECGTHLQGEAAGPPEASGPAWSAPSFSSPPEPHEGDQPPPAPAPAPPPPAAAETPGLARVTLKRNGVLTEHVFPLGARVLVGRFDPETGPVDLDLGPLEEWIYISRRHAEIWRNDAGQWFARDLSSRNGTWVRQAGQSEFKRVTGEHPLGDGDEIALGNARFEFRVG